MEKNLVKYFEVYPLRVIGVILGLVAVATLIGRGTEIYIFPLLKGWGL